MDAPDLVDSAKKVDNAMRNLAEALEDKDIPESAQLVSNACIYMGRVAAEFEKVNTGLKEVQTKLENKVDTFDSLETALEDQKAANKALEAANKTLVDGTKALEATNKTLDDGTKALDAKLQEQKQENETLGDELQGAKDANKTLARALEVETDNSDTLRVTNTGLETKLQDLGKEVKWLATELQEQKDANGALCRDKETLGNKVEGLEREIQAHKNTAALLQRGDGAHVAAYQSLKDANEKLNKTVDAQATELGNHKTANRSLREFTEGKVKQLNTSRAENEALTAKVSGLEKELDVYKKKNETLCKEAEEQATALQASKAANEALSDKISGLATELKASNEKNDSLANGLEDKERLLRISKEANDVLRRAVEGKGKELQGLKATNETLFKTIDNLKSMVEQRDKALASSDGEKVQLALANQALHQVQEKHHEHTKKLLQDLTEALSETPWDVRALNDRFKQFVLGANLGFEHFEGKIQGLGTDTQIMGSVILDGIETVKQGQASQDVTLAAHTDTLKSQSEAVDTMAADTKKRFGHQLGLGLQMRQQLGETQHNVLAVKDSTAALSAKVDGSVSRSQVAVTKAISAEGKATRQALTETFQTGTAGITTEIRDLAKTVTTKVGGVDSRVDEVVGQVHEVVGQVHEVVGQVKQQDIEIDAAHEDIEIAFGKLDRHRTDINNIIRKSKGEKRNEQSKG